MYTVKEVFYTLQGEGARAGRPAVFCRFSGCNLWNGIESGRKDAICKFCDTDFIGTNGALGGKYKTATDLAMLINSQWPQGYGYKYAVLTGGEPLLQVDSNLIEELHRFGFEIAVETNGTIEVPAGIDWICVSPKSISKIRQVTGNELKLVYPQVDADPKIFEKMTFDYFYLQPMDGPDKDQNTELALLFCQKNPKWSLSIQTHKLLNIR
jgi:7-carboxy-7-deazaguanine synthase (Cx14CxxC type)